MKLVFPSEQMFFRWNSIPKCLKTLSHGGKWVIQKVKHDKQHFHAITKIIMIILSVITEMIDDKPLYDR